MTTGAAHFRSAETDVDGVVVNKDAGGLPRGHAWLTTRGLTRHALKVEVPDGADAVGHASPQVHSVEALKTQATRADLQSSEPTTCFQRCVCVCACACACVNVCVRMRA